jgi:hypothetical protein
MERVQEHASEMSSRADESDARVAALEVRSLLSLLSLLAFTSTRVHILTPAELQGEIDDLTSRLAAAHRELEGHADFAPRYSAYLRYL